MGEWSAKEARQLAADLTNQFALYFTKDGVEMVSTGGLLELEDAFDFFNIPDPCKLGLFHEALRPTDEAVPETPSRPTANDEEEEWTPQLPQLGQFPIAMPTRLASIASIQAAVWEQAAQIADRIARLYAETDESPTGYPTTETCAAVACAVNIAAEIRAAALRKREND